MPKHPRIVAGVASTSALLLLGLPAAAEEQATTAPTDEAAPATDDCGVEPEEGGTEPEAEQPPAPDAGGDGVPDAEDDADGDGEPDAAPSDDDVDGDGVPDAEDDDADGDGTRDVGRQTDVDVDGDRIPDGEDDDADGDGEPDDTAGADADAEDDAAPTDGCETGAGEPAPAVAPESEPAPEPEAHAGEAPDVPVEVPPPPAEEAVDPVPPSLDDVPGDVLAEIAAYPRTPAGSTAELVEALRPLAAAGLGADEIAAVGFGRFPVGGEATWIHDWLFPRYVPSFHTHEGIDIFAERGTPVRAPADGVVHVSNGSIGGLAVKVVEADGTYWYMSHLDAVVAGIDGARVAAGTVVGTVGDSGNAKGGSPHVHLQLHPQGGEPVDPKPAIDQLADEALAGVPAVLAAHSGPSVVFSGFTWEPASVVERREPERDPILDLLLPLARLADEAEHDHENESGHPPEDE